MSLITLSNGARFEAGRGSSMLDAALASGVVIERNCRRGRSGNCKARVTRGEAAPLRNPVSLTADEALHRWMLPCTHEAFTDVQLPALAGAAVYACGSEAMIHGARRLLADLGLPEKRFYFDAFVSSN